MFHVDDLVKTAGHNPSSVNKYITLELKNFPGLIFKKCLIFVGWQAAGL